VHLEKISFCNCNGLSVFGINAVRNIKIDIFPDLNLPVIYISHPYVGFTPTQMEAFFGKQYVNLLLYVSGKILNQETYRALL